MAEQAIVSFPEHPNRLIEQGRKDRDFETARCRNWKELPENDGIAGALADYAGRVFDPRLTDEQDAAIRSWPVQSLRLLRSLVVQAICPDPMPLKLFFTAELCGDRPPGICFDLNAADEAVVTSRAEEIL